MTVIIVDDDKYKRQNIISSLKNILGEETKFIECEYRNKALSLLYDLKEDINKKTNDYLLVLDMCFPVLLDTQAESDMGIDFLHQLQRRKILIPTIMCSCDKIEKSDIDNFENILGTIEYDSSVWLQPLFEAILKN